MEDVAQRRRTIAFLDWGRPASAPQHGHGSAMCQIRRQPRKCATHVSWQQSGTSDCLPFLSVLTTAIAHNCTAASCHRQAHRSERYGRDLDHTIRGASHMALTRPGGDEKTAEANASRSPIETGAPRGRIIVVDDEPANVRLLTRAAGARRPRRPGRDQRRRGARPHRARTAGPGADGRRDAATGRLRLREYETEPKSRRT